MRFSEEFDRREIGKEDPGCGEVKGWISRAQVTEIDDAAEGAL